MKLITRNDTPAVFYLPFCDKTEDDVVMTSSVTDYNSIVILQYTFRFCKSL